MLAWGLRDRQGFSCPGHYSIKEEPGFEDWPQRCHYGRSQQTYLNSVSNTPRDEPGSDPQRGSLTPPAAPCALSLPVPHYDHHFLWHFYPKSETPLKREWVEEDAVLVIQMDGWFDLWSYKVPTDTMNTYSVTIWTLGPFSSCSGASCHIFGNLNINISITTGLAASWNMIGDPEKIQNEVRLFFSSSVCKDRN